MRNTEFDPAESFDLALYSLGYERRSSYLARLGLKARRHLAVPFVQSQVGAFGDNRRVFEARGFEIHTAREDDYQVQLRQILAEMVGDRLAVDISSMTRARLAATLLELERAATNGRRDLAVSFFYCPAAFVPPTPQDVGTLLAEPLPGFVGPLRRASLPVGAVIGLGYEAHRALGILEFLEPATAWLMSPVSSGDYEQAVARANENVMAAVPDSHRLQYSIFDPAGTVYALDSLAFAAGDTRRLVLVPMGPKIFALASLLVGMGTGDKRPAVWRVSEGSRRTPVRAEESGEVVGLEVVLPGPEVVREG